jgi:predicted benzoate:H+ symporter BenE
MVGHFTINQIERWIMKVKTVTGIEYLQWGACANCKAVSGKGKKRYRYIASIMAISLLLISGVFSVSLYAAVPTQAAITADVAAGTDVATIISNAVAAGMTVQKAVESIVKAGADPAAVVYRAITAGYPAQDVIKGAAAGIDSSSPGQVAKIVSAARQAGVSESDINSWLASAGVSASVIASAGTLATQSPASVQGYSAPRSDIPLTGIIGGSGIGGGGGGGAPPTKQASPSKP